MSKQTRVSHPIYHLLPTEISGFDSLAGLALDMHWSWNHATDEVWRQLGSRLWDITHNPWVVLQTVSRDRIEQVLADPVFREKVHSLIEASRQAAEAPAWFQQAHSQSPLTCAAYFSMEFMLSEALPIYSGGLGNVAGDQLKAASDLGVPVVGVGLLYQQGYFRQVIDKNGEQQALYPYNDPGQLPITPLRQPNGEWLGLEIALPRAWDIRLAPGAASHGQLENRRSLAVCRRRAYAPPSGVRNGVSEQPQPDSCIQSERIRRRVEVRYARISLQYMRLELASIQGRNRQDAKALLEEFKLGPVSAQRVERYCGCKRHFVNSRSLLIAAG